MHKRYELKYGKLLVRDVIGETAKQFTYQYQDWFTGRTIISRKSKEGTFLTIREALEDSLTRLRRQAEREAEALQKSRSQIGELESVLKKSDEQIEKAMFEAQHQ